MGRRKSTVRGKLLGFMLPIVAASILVIALFVSIRATSIITDLSKKTLMEEALGNSETLGNEISEIEAKFDAIIDSIRDSGIRDIDVICDVVQASYGMAGTENTAGIYFGLSDKFYYDASGWKPDGDYDPTSRPWYQNGYKNSTFFPGTPYVPQDTGIISAPIGRKMEIAGGKEGVASCDFQLGKLSEEVAELSPLGIGKSVLLSTDTIISYGDGAHNGEAISSQSGDAMLQALAGVGLDNVSEINVGGKAYFAVANALSGTDWRLVSYADKNGVLASVRSFQLIALIIAAAVLVIVTIALLILVKNVITNPVKSLTHAITSIAGNDFTVDIQSKSSDEIGQMEDDMKNYVGGMRDTLTRMSSISQNLNHQASVCLDSTSTMTAQTQEQSASMEQMRQAINGINESVNELANNATELAGQVGDLLAQGNDTSATVTDIVAKAEKSRDEMKTVTNGMEKIVASMNDMEHVVASVDESARKINDIIEMINDIASQTNLLSLNASIEAARAGEAGKGFAVVADEIGKLANNSAEATTQIASIINTVTGQIKNLSEKSSANVQSITDSAELVVKAEETFSAICSDLEAANDTVEEMINRISSVNDIATSVAAISEEQSASTEEVTATIDQVAENSKQVADGSVNVTNAASTVSESSDQIRDFVSNFKLQ